MAVLKCKMCGGDLDVSEGASIIKCDYCGTNQTIPIIKDEGLQNLFNRANTMRIKCEFDKAEKLYEKIIQTDESQAEAYWGLILCKYGIEYVEDPKTFNRIPTCHRTSYETVVVDEDYKQALKYADVLQKGIYEAEAKQIDEIQRGILSIAKNEEPYDVFICYKETDETGRRTQDSVIANDIYYQLTQEGFKVFYAAITLEDKLGKEYEPIIFAALNSAKVMLAIGTKPEYFNAVWVKNEWSRYLKMMKNDRNKMFIPCYRDMDAYELPEEFAHLQAQDISKIGFINDIVRGIKKVIKKEEANTSTAIATETITASNNASIQNFIKRAYLALEDRDFKSANEFAEKALNIDAECIEAYLVKLFSELNITEISALATTPQEFFASPSYKNAYRFADEKFSSQLKELEKAWWYNKALPLMKDFSQQKNLLDAKQALINAGDYKDAQTLLATFEKEWWYNMAISLMHLIKNKITFQYIKKALSNAGDYEDAQTLLLGLSEYRDKKIVTELRTFLAQQRLTTQPPKQEILQAYYDINLIHDPELRETIRLEFAEIENEKQYKIATNLMQKQDYTAAVDIFKTISHYRDSAVLMEQCDTQVKEKLYLQADGLMTATQYSDAILAFEEIKEYKDSAIRAEKCRQILDDKKKKTHKALRVLKNRIALSSSSIIGIKADATLSFWVRSKTHKHFQDISSWKDIVAIASTSYYTVGLKSDGTVVAVGNNNYAQCNVSSWRDIVAIAVSGVHTVGLKSDGTVVAVGNNDYGQCNISSWKNIVAIAVSVLHTVGLKSDGTVVAVGNNKLKQCNVANWKDIVAIAVSDYHTVGLKADGTVVAVGYYKENQCNVSSWSDIVAISAGSDHTVGLKSDGTVVAVGSNNDGCCNTSAWKDIVTIFDGGNYTIGIKLDGTVVSTTSTILGDKFNVNSWKLFNSIDIFEKEIQEKKKYRTASVCQHCGGGFKGLFTKTCSSCGKKKDY